MKKLKFKKPVVLGFAALFLAKHRLDTKNADKEPEFLWLVSVFCEF